MTIRTKAAIAAGCCLLSIPVLALEKMSDEQLSTVQAKGAYNFAFENIEFRGTEIPGVAEAGSINSIGTDGSSLGLKQFQFSAGSIGTLTSPLTTESVVANGSVNGNSMADRSYLRIGLPEAAGWNNVDIAFDAVYGNPTELDPENPNIAVGGTPSSNGRFGLVSIDDISVTGHLDVSSIPTGFKISSVHGEDGGLLSREGLLLNVAIDELKMNQVLFEPGTANGVFDGDRDLVINNFVLENLSMNSATIETTSSGWRFAYSDPQPFKGSLGETLTPGVSGHPDTASPNYNPDFPKANLSFESQMTHSQVSESRLQGVTLDHLVFNVRND
ncbi:hypothetical protein [Hydrocarboniclastica marina]|uniref:PEP-CTERM sorting domain-containing protein n=1 Tax=Hydrocarboniclastica marina TaxID=2259620 RepID=A0A4P7XLZ2_9ALTE|nr:hypothetical protein [Hydrocarboniclastica marina]MAL98207.1 hypothetical protein [Alteromonadaceae bacterium]QCF27007.1 hypothetical protein soil367_14290 [Hydrocarboniclastica marina]|tara:strand:- start:2600 stop:3589 length:990 start_codon:yes stop_codon:yes gene_type:complete